MMSRPRGDDAEKEVMEKKRPALHARHRRRGGRRRLARRQTLHDLGLLGFERGVDLRDMGVGEVLGPRIPTPLHVILGHALALGLLDLVHAVAAHVADRDAGVFGVLGRDLGQLGAAFLGSARGSAA